MLRMNQNRHKKHRTLSLGVVALALFWLCACSGSSSSDRYFDEVRETGLFTNRSIQVNGVDRHYDYYVPAGLDSSKPALLFLLHGGGSEPADLTGESGFKAPYKVWMEIADSEKFIVVYPEGSLNSAGDLGWNDCRADATTNPSLNDVDFIETLIDFFISTSNIDAERIYVSGTSNGGHMAIRLAFELAHKIAAIAPVVAALPAVPVAGCAVPEQPLSVLFMNGTDDPLLPFMGGEVAVDSGGRGTVLSIQESLAVWVTFNRTDVVPVISHFPDINSFDGSTVKKSVYANGIEETEVLLYEVVGGGHVEPSQREQYSALVELLLGRQNHDIEMANEIWMFFKDKTLQ